MKDEPKTEETEEEQQDANVMLEPVAAGAEVPKPDGADVGVEE